MADEYPKLLNPHEYQKKASHWLVSGAERILFLDMGLGKTVSFLMAFMALQRAKAIDRCLVIAPKKTCYTVWSHEEGMGELWKWKNFHAISVSLLHGKHKEEALHEDADLYVINHDGMRWLFDNQPGKKQKRIQVLFKNGVKAFCIDELSAFKNASGLRSRCLFPYASRFHRRYGLTATPAPNGIIDLFNQVRIIDLGKRLGKYESQFGYKYFERGGFKGKEWIPQDDAEKRIYAKLADIALPMKGEDHLDLPKVVNRNIFVKLPKPAMAAYSRMEREFLAALEGGIITASNAGVASGKLRQIASGAVYADESIEDLIAQREEGAEIGEVKRRVHQVHKEKLEALKEIVEEAQGNPILLAYMFDHDRENIMKVFGKDTPALYGATTDRQAIEICKRWNRGEIPLLLGHPAAMGHGLNLQGSGNHIVWYSHTWNLEQYIQLRGRVHRQGQKAKRVFVHHIIAKDTIDEIVVQRLRMKNKTQQDLIDGIKALHKKRSKS